MKKIWKGKKALSPVVAAIILIAVTVAVSIAVAAWMGALTFTFMGTEQLEIQGCTFNEGTPNSVTLAAQNTGTADLTVNKYKISVSGVPTALTEVKVEQGASANVDVPLDWTSGQTYDIYLITSTGKQFPYRATAP
jgi:flagellin-like protein